MEQPGSSSPPLNANLRLKHMLLNLELDKTFDIPNVPRRSGLNFKRVRNDVWVASCPQNMTLDLPANFLSEVSRAIDILSRGTGKVDYQLLRHSELTVDEREVVCISLWKFLAPGDVRYERQKLVPVGLLNEEPFIEAEVVVSLGQPVR
jgi:hypothetical protein